MLSRGKGEMRWRRTILTVRGSYTAELIIVLSERRTNESGLDTDNLLERSWRASVDAHRELK